MDASDSEATSYSLHALKERRTRSVMHSLYGRRHIPVERPARRKVVKRHDARASRNRLTGKEKWQHPGPPDRGGPMPAV